MSNLALMIFSSVRLVTSVCPFSCGCPGDENWFLIPRLEQKSLKPWLSNCCSLSDIIIRGIPNLQIMVLHTKLWILASVIVANASALTHFVKYLIATSPVLYLGAMGQRCRFPIVQMVKGRLSSSISRLEGVGHSQTSGTCRTS